MTELLPSVEHHEALPTGEKHEALPAHAEHKAEHGAAEQAQKLQEARQEALSQASAENPVTAHENQQAAPQEPQGHRVNRELKAITLNRELKTIRRQLNGSEKSLSKVMHQPAVRVVSETAAKSVARPSGLLGGGLVAFLGTTGYLLLAKHIGFTYNFSVFFVLLVVGFAVGVALETIVWLTVGRRIRRSA